MVPFTPRLAGPPFSDELDSRIAAGLSVVILGPRFCGKRYALQRALERARARSLSPIGVLGAAARPLRTTTDLARGLATALDVQNRVSASGEVFASVDLVHEETDKPVLLFVENVDAMAHHVARAFLEGVRERVEDRRLIVLLTGEHDLRDLVYGPRSEFNCANQYLLQGYGPQEFARIVARFASALNLAIEPEPPPETDSGPERGPNLDADPRMERSVTACLYALTGGNTVLLRLALATLLEHHIGEGYPNQTLTVDDLKPLAFSDSMLGTFWAQLPRYGVQLIAWEPDCWRDLESLLDGSSPPPRPAEWPGALEFSGLAVRRGPALRFASHLMRDFARRYYTPRRIADLYARKGDWREAFERYGELPAEEILRPTNYEDRTEVEAALRSLGASLHAAVGHGVDRLKHLLSEGSRKLLGFQEVTFWRFDRHWQLEGPDRPAALFEGIPPRLPLTSATPGCFPLATPLGKYAIAATLKGPSAELRSAVVISNLASQTVISRERERLGRELLEQFIDAHSHALEVAASRARLVARDKHLAIVNDIIASIGLFDVHPLLVIAANGLRGLGYKRVLFCLVDPLRQRIVGAHDSSSDGVDLARPTDFPLADPIEDIQPYVVRSGQPRIVPDASLEPLANATAVAKARLQGFAIVPMLDREERAIGTIHIERIDRSAPTREEVADLLLFGRQLAAVIAHSERVELQQNALDKCPEPVLITDQFERVRYANSQAAALFEISAGWRDSQQAPRLAPGMDKVRGAIKQALAGGTSTGFVHGVGRTSDYRGTMFFDHVVDWRKKIVGSVLHLRQQNALYNVTEATVSIANAPDLEKALDRIVDAVVRLMPRSDGWARLYLIAPEDPTLLVGVRSRGMSSSGDAAFNSGATRLPRLGHCKVSWRSLEEKWPVMFSWRQNQAGEDETVIRSAVLPELVLKQAPPLARELEKRVGTSWIDVPLMTPDETIGKLTLSCAQALRPDEYESWSFFGRQVGQLIVAFRQRQERERWVANGIETSMSAVAHNLGTRLGGLSPLLAEYRFEERERRSIKPLNDRFELQLNKITKTITRTKEMLSSVVLHSERFDLHAMLASVFDPQGARPSVLGFDCPQPFEIHGDEHLLESALVELLQNSRQMIGDPARLSVQVNVSMRLGHAVPLVAIDYTDNGPGVQAALKKRIFEPFFSERPGGKKGTGLGLAFVQRVIKAHGGTIEECGEEGRSARFLMRLPDSARAGSAETAE